MKKKAIAIILCSALVLSMVGCGTSSGSDAAVSAQSTETVVDDSAVTSSEQEESVSAEEQQEAEDEAELAAIGEIEVDNGLVFVKITVPADYVGETTQEELDAKTGDTFTSAVLNEDGSVTYKMTKAQHDQMLDELRGSFDEGLQELIDDDENYTITDIQHNDDYTEFDVYLEGTEAGLGDLFVTLALYMYGGLWGIFNGTTVDNVAVNFYDPDGNLVDSANSADMGDSSDTEDTAGAEVSVQ